MFAIVMEMLPSEGSGALIFEGESRSGYRLKDIFIDLFLGTWIALMVLVLSWNVGLFVAGMLTVLASGVVALWQFWLKKNVVRRLVVYKDRIAYSGRFSSLELEFRQVSHLFFEDSGQLRVVCNRGFLQMQYFVPMEAEFEEFFVRLADGPDLLPVKMEWTNHPKFCRARERGKF